MNEQQIIAEIERYLEDQSYNYAVLIDGEWGSGKTFFVKHSLSEAIKKSEELRDTPRKIKYISLYGNKTMADVQENIAWSFAENARKKVAEKVKMNDTADIISTNVINSSRKIGNMIVKKFLPEGSVYEIASDWLNMGAYIYIFDDLERCECPINEVFGFLNELVEHGDAKVILVANEKEISGVSEAGVLEQQYQIALDSRIKWPEKESNSPFLRRENNRNEQITLSEMDRRRNLLFPKQDANKEYKRIREKLIGVTLKYEPSLSCVISEIIGGAYHNDEIKPLLENMVESFESTMELYRHKNLRTFQFFLSKVSFLIDNMNRVGIERPYNQPIAQHIINETFSHAVKFKSNYKPPRDDYTWLPVEQECKSKSIRNYVETGDFSEILFKEDVLCVQEELRANIPSDDPYYLIDQGFYWHTQAWCEEQLELLIKQLKANIYPIALYVRIVVTTQRLLDLGFDPNYMTRIKNSMIDNISQMGEVRELDSDLWYIDDVEFKDRVNSIVDEVNDSIIMHTSQKSRENIQEILNGDNWVDGLEKYTNPEGARYIQGKTVFSKADIEDWMRVLKSASPKDIDDFRHWLRVLYPSDLQRDNYKDDGSIIKQLIDELKNLDVSDLIKKQEVVWLIGQLESIVAINEPENIQILSE